MKGQVSYLWIIAFAVLIIGCIPDDLPVGRIPQLKSKIVVSSHIASDQSLVIFLTKSVGALDASEDSDVQELLDQITINDALVIVSGDNVSDTLELVDQGLYASTSLPLTVGETYQLFIESPAMGTVTAETTVKGQVVFESLEGNIYNTGYDTLAELRYSFQDPAGKNFYMINVQRITTEYEPEDFLNPRVFTKLTNDSGFDQQLHMEDLKVFGGRDFVPGDTLGVFLSNINEEYYDFMQLRLDSRFNFSDFLGEPANYPTNVKGGLGFFNLHIPDVRILILEEQ